MDSAEDPSLQEPNPWMLQTRTRGSVQYISVV